MRVWRKEVAWVVFWSRWLWKWVLVDLGRQKLRKWAGDQVMQTLDCQLRTSMDRGDPRRGACSDPFLSISHQSLRDTDIWTSDSFLEIGRCHWPEGMVFSVSSLYLEAEFMGWSTYLFSVSKWTLFPRLPVSFFPFFFITLLFPLYFKKFIYFLLKDNCFTSLWVSEWLHFSRAEVWVRASEPLTCKGCSQVLKRCQGGTGLDV